MSDQSTPNAFNQNEEPSFFASMHDIYTVIPDDKPRPSGANGVVFRANSKKTGLRVIIKYAKIAPVDDQSLEASIGYLNAKLDAELKVHQKLTGLNCIAHLIDHGDIDRGPTFGGVRFNVYQEIVGHTLREWCNLYANARGKPKFQGIAEPEMWFHLAYNLISSLSQIHGQKVVHGDISRDNIMIRQSDKHDFSSSVDPVFIDFGSGMVLAQAPAPIAERHLWFNHWAPERVKHRGSNPRWYRPADVYSLGNLLLFLATGENDIVPFLPIYATPRPDREGCYFINDIHHEPTFKRQRDIKAEIHELILRHNRGLLEKYPFVSELVMFAMRPTASQRAKHAGTVGQLLNALVPLRKRDTGSRMQELRTAVSQLKSTLDDVCNSRIHPMLSTLILSDLEKTRLSLGNSTVLLLDRQGNRDELILDLVSCCGELQSGDNVRGVVTLALMEPENLGLTGRVLASFVTACRRGANIELAILVHPERSTDLSVESITSELKKRQSESKPDDGRFDVKIYKLPLIQYEKFTKGRGSFLLLSTADGVLVVDADYDSSGGLCTALRFGSWTPRSPEIEQLSQEFQRFFNLDAAIRDIQSTVLWTSVPTASVSA